MATLIAVYANWGFARIQGVGWGWAGVVWLYSIVFYFPLDIMKFAIRYILSGKAWLNLLENKVYSVIIKIYFLEDHVVSSPLKGGFQERRWMESRHGGRPPPPSPTQTKLKKKKRKKGKKQKVDNFEKIYIIFLLSRRLRLLPKQLWSCQVLFVKLYYMLLQLNIAMTIESPFKESPKYILCIYAYTPLTLLPLKDLSF